MSSKQGGKRTGGRQDSPDVSDAGSQAFEKQAALYVFDMIRRFMGYGYRQGIFTEEDPQHQTMALFSALMEYLLVITAPSASPLYNSNEEAVRSFIYQSMVAALGGDIQEMKNYRIETEEFKKAD